MSDNTNTELFELSEPMWDALDLWEYGLQPTGGALVPSKIRVHPVSFKWYRSGKYYDKEPDISDTNNKMTVKNEGSIRVTLEHRSPTVDSVTLGIP